MARNTIAQLLGTELPLIQAPMAGAQGSAMAIAVSNAGALGSLPCAMLAPDAIRAEIEAIRQAIGSKPYNVIFFCHHVPVPDAGREAAWRKALAPYYAEFGIDAANIPAGAGRNPFSDAGADVLEAFRPPVVSFHFGLPSEDLLARVRGWGAKVLSSATTVEEAQWLAARGVDAVIAQGLEAGGHRGHFLSHDLSRQVGTFTALSTCGSSAKVPTWRLRSCERKWPRCPPASRPCAITTVEEAQWLAARGVDAVIAQGLEAGGHRGHFLSHDLSRQVGIFALLPQVLKAVKVPVIAAGGIVDAASARAAMALGAAGVQVGTSYLLCPEATITAPHRAALSGNEEARRHTALTNLFTGRPARGIMNRVMRELGPLSAAPPEFPLATAAIAPLRAKAEGQGSGDFSPLWSGQNASGCKAIGAAELTREIAAGLHGA